eukprot:1693735-Pyramimonas_sp.AAC.1
MHACGNNYRYERRRAVAPAQTHCLPALPHSRTKGLCKQKSECFTRVQLANEASHLGDQHRMVSEDEPCKWNLLKPGRASSMA